VTLTVPDQLKAASAACSVAGEVAGPLPVMAVTEADGSERLAPMTAATLNK
jgi:hypothetical protein